MVATQRFDALGANEIFNMGVESGEDAANFDAMSPIPASVIKQLAVRNLPDIEYVDIRPIREQGCYQGLFELSYGGGEGDYEHAYKIDFSRQEFLSGMMINHHGERGLGRQKMFGNRALVGLVLGFKTMIVEAGDMMGGRVWASSGLQVKDIHRTLLRRDLAERYMVLEDHLDGEQRAALENYCELDYPNDLQMIAAMTDIVDAQPDDFDQALERTAISGLVPYTYDDYENSGFMGDWGMTIADFMLCGLRYDGHINMMDADQMQTLENFTGRALRKEASCFLTTWHRPPMDLNMVCRHLLRNL